MATGTIANTMTWKLFDSKTGTSALTLPSQYNELMIVSEYIFTDGGGNKFDYTLPIVISKAELQATSGFQRRAFTGYNSGSRCNVGIRFAADLSTVELMECYIDNNNRTSVTTVRGYYR